LFVINKKNGGYVIKVGDITQAVDHFT